MRKKLTCLLLSVLAATPAVASPPDFPSAAALQPMALMSGGAQDAKSCISLEEGAGSPIFVNSCGYTVHVSWCVVGRNCQNGLDNSANIDPRGTKIAADAYGENVEIRWGACRGANTLTSEYGSLDYSCGEP